MSTASGMHSYGSSGGMIAAENGEAQIGMSMHQMNIYEQPAPQRQQQQQAQSCLSTEIAHAVPTCLASERSSPMRTRSLQTPSPKKEDSSICDDVHVSRDGDLHDGAATPSFEEPRSPQQEQPESDDQKHLSESPSPKYEHSSTMVTPGAQSPQQVSMRF
ncbi:unnamed protein product [Toxocara canis]|uniref:Uncharacterized protein n=1 Tax=Toxocara canis TaxID=6265 RepID=A0A183U8Y3_TOXCA|nr:unnamed protein product [Toxocara canis]